MTPELEVNIIHDALRFTSMPMDAREWLVARMEAVLRSLAANDNGAA